MPNPTTPNPDLELVTEALRARAGQRQRASTALSTELADRRAAGVDVRSGALKVIDELAASARLSDLADQLEAGALALRPALAPGGPLTIPGPTFVAAGLPIIDLSDPEAPADLLAAAAAAEGVDKVHAEDVDGIEVDLIDDAGDDADLDEALAALTAAAEAVTA